MSTRIHCKAALKSRSLTLREQSAFHHLSVSVHGQGLVEALADWNSRYLAVE